MPEKIKKEFKHRKIESCKISKKPIDTSKDQYCILLDCQGKDIMGVGFYKVEILRELFQGNSKKIVDDMMQRQGKLAQGLFEKLGLMPKVVNI